MLVVISECLEHFMVDQSAGEFSALDFEISYKTILQYDPEKYLHIVETNFSIDILYITQNQK